MTVRRRILLAALAVGVGAALVGLIWSAGPKQPEPKLEFTLCFYTNYGGNYAIVNVKNLRNRPVNLTGYSVLHKNDGFEPIEFVRYPSLPLESHGSFMIGLALDHFGRAWSTNEPWRFQLFVERKTLSNKLRGIAQNLPVIGQHIDPPNDYKITSDTFNQ